ncbi:hypothetical protein BH09PAT4_BH09PAT4_01870 [soil metagenome]
MEPLFNQVDEIAKQKAEEAKAKKQAKEQAKAEVEMEEKRKKNPLL